MNADKLIEYATAYDKKGEFKKADSVTRVAIRLTTASTCTHAAGELRDLASVIEHEVDDTDSKLPQILKTIEGLWHLIYKPDATQQPLLQQQPNPVAQFHTDLKQAIGQEPHDTF